MLYVLLFIVNLKNTPNCVNLCTVNQRCIYTAGRILTVSALVNRFKLLFFVFLRPICCAVWAKPELSARSQIDCEEAQTKASAATTARLLPCRTRYIQCSAPVLWPKKTTYETVTATLQGRGLVTSSLRPWGLFKVDFHLQDTIYIVVMVIFAIDFISCEEAQSGRFSVLTLVLE